jgi:hypothetical protein
MKKLLCAFGFHRFVWERLADLVDSHPIIRIKRTRYTVKVRHCERCGELEVKVCGKLQPIP